MQLESSVMRRKEVHGGNGFAAATVGDLGFKPTLGATSADAKPVRGRRVRIEVGEGLSAAGVSPAGGFGCGGFGWWGFGRGREAHPPKEGRGGVRRRLAES